MGAIVLGLPEIWGAPISDKKFVNSVLKKRDLFGFKLYQLKYEKFRWLLNHFRMLR